MYDLCIEIREILRGAMPYYLIIPSSGRGPSWLGVATTINEGHRTWWHFESSHCGKKN
jgi:hypothetical protein